jgi:hypothetical protein
MSSPGMPPSNQSIPNRWRNFGKELASPSSVIAIIGAVTFVLLFGFLNSIDNRVNSVGDSVEKASRDANTRIDAHSALFNQRISQL